MTRTLVFVFCGRIMKVVKKKKKCYARSKHLGIKDSDQNHYKNHKLWVWKFLYIPISGFVYESNEKLDYGSRYVFIWGRFLLG